MGQASLIILTILITTSFVVGFLFWPLGKGLISSLTMAAGSALGLGTAQALVGLARLAGFRLQPGLASTLVLIVLPCTLSVAGLVIGSAIYSHRQRT